VHTHVGRRSAIAKPWRKRPLHPDRWEHSLLVGLDCRSREAKVLFAAAVS
jgi:hypothetical protein